MQDMIMATETASLLDGQEVSRLFDNADEISAPFGVGADGTGVGLGKSKTARTELDGAVQF